MEESVSPEPRPNRTSAGWHCVFVGDRSFDDADFEGALGRARDLIWSISVAARAVVNQMRGHSAATMGGDSQRPRRARWRAGRSCDRGSQGPHPNVGGSRLTARVLAEEPDLNASLIDFDTVGDAVTTLVTELSSSASDDVVAWRQDSRYVERLSRAVLDADAPATVVRNDASYIVTGGLGGLGMVVARWLIGVVGRLILNGRTDPSDDQRKILSEMGVGAEIVFVGGDIASPEVAEQLVAAAEKTGHQLRGVVHAAGVLDDSLVSALTQENLERVWSAKVTGALRLHAATASRQLDWWLDSPRWPRCSDCRGKRRTPLPTPGSMHWSPGAAHRCLPATAIDWGRWVRRRNGAFRRA